MKYEELAKQTLKNVGGCENITMVAHCATRLRISYKDKQLINEEAIKSLPDVAGVVSKEGQIQLIIGPAVNDAYNDFLQYSGWTQGNEKKEDKIQQKETDKKNFKYYVNKFGNFMAPVFMPIVPALITGGMILAIKNLCVNYFGMSVDSGTAQVMLAIFRAGFTFLPVYIGYTLSKSLKMEPIMGAFLGALLVSPSISGAEGLDFFGIAIPVVDYGSSVFPIFLGVFFMYYVDKVLKKIIPEMFVYFLKPLLTMLIVVPVTLVVLGPIGTELSGAVGNCVMALTNAIGSFATPILSALYPYLVMFGLDKTFTPIKIQLIAEMGFDPILTAVGYISNICIGAAALAVATTIKEKGKKGMFASFGVTALCGVTEPAFYGALISRPKALIGVACGAVAGGLVAGIFKLYSYIAGGCPGLLTFLFFVDESGDVSKMILAIIVAAVSIAVTFVVTKIIMKKDEKSA